MRRLGGTWAMGLVAIACTANCGRDIASDTEPAGEEGGSAGQAAVVQPEAGVGLASPELGGGGSGARAQTDGGSAGEGAVAGGSSGEGAVTGGSSGEGAVVGGSSGEGAVTGGAPGAPVSLPPPQLPEGCAILNERTLRGGANGGCAIDIDCYGVPDMEVVCWTRADGSWNCSESHNKQDELDLAGLTGSDVCRFAGNVFATGVDALLTDEAACIPELRSNAAGLCEIRDLCQLRADFGSGIQGTLSRRQGVRCSGSPALCDCYDGERYRIEGLELAASCARGYELCEEPEPAPEGATECGDASTVTTLGVNECMTSIDCTTTTEVENGISHLHRFSRNIQCQAIGPMDLDGSVCYCNSDIGSFTFESALLVEDDSARTCERFHSLCVQPEAFDVQGPDVCDPPTLTVNEPYGCVMRRSCWRPAVLDGESVVANAGNTVRCRPDDDSFRCECDDRFDDAFFLEAPSFADACTAALAECPEPAFVRPQR